MVRLVPPRCCMDSSAPLSCLHNALTQVRHRMLGLIGTWIVKSHLADAMAERLDVLRRIWLCRQLNNAMSTAPVTQMSD